MHDALRDAVRNADGQREDRGLPEREGADTVGRDSHDYDADKKINGRKRHIVTDTLGLLVVVMVTIAVLQDRDGGRLVLGRAKMKMPSVVLVWADGGYAGK